MKISMLSFHYCYYSCTVSVQAQSCRSSADCSGGYEIGEMTIEECCLKTSDGLALQQGNSCTPCIGLLTFKSPVLNKNVHTTFKLLIIMASVFGFLDESFVGIEQEHSHAVMAGWQKGAALIENDLIFDVTSTGITASEFRVC